MMGTGVFLIERRLLPCWRYVWLLGLFCVGSLLVACEQAAVATPTPTTITLAGATAMQPVLHDLTAEFTRRHPQVLFNWLGGSSTIGETQVEQRQIDLAASTLTPPEIDAVPGALPARPTLMHIPIGLDGLAIVVHPSNSVENLTLLQLHDLFSGKILDWSELGSASGEVMLVSREDGSGSRHLFEMQVMVDDPVALTAVVMPTSADVVEFVALNPQAIGYVSRAYVMPELRTAAGGDSDQTAPVQPNGVQRRAVRIVRVENEWPTDATLSNRRYFLTQPLYLVSRGAPRGWSREFVDFVLSPAGQAIVARYHVRVR